MKSKSFVLFLILVFVVVVSCIVGGYYWKNRQPEKNGGNDKKGSIVYEVTDSKILDILKIFDGPGCQTVVEEFLNDHKVLAKDISSNTAMAVPWKRGDLGEQTSISLEEYTKYVQKYFGEDYNFQPKDGEGLLCIWEYSASKKSFERNLDPICGCTLDPGYTRYRISKAVETDHVLEIDLRVVFYRSSSDSFYGDYEATRSLPGVGLNGVAEFYASEEAYAQADLYKLIFKESNGNYIFVSAERV